MQPNQHTHNTGPSLSPSTAEPGGSFPGSVRPHARTHASPPCMGPSHQETQNQAPGPRQLSAARARTRTGAGTGTGAGTSMAFRPSDLRGRQLSWITKGCLNGRRACIHTDDVLGIIPCLGYIHAQGREGQIACPVPPAHRKSAVVLVQQASSKQQQANPNPSWLSVPIHLVCECEQANSGRAVGRRLESRQKRDMGPAFHVHAR